MPEHTVVVLGALDVKSELVNQFSQMSSINGNVQSPLDTTECRKQIVVDRVPCTVVLREPAVNVEDSNLLSESEQQRFGQADALIVWYSITDRDGFLKAKNLSNKARALRTRAKHGNIPIALNDNCPLLLIAIHPPYSSSDQWKVTYSEGDILAKELHCGGFVECTIRSTSGEAVRNESVERAIAEVIREIRKVEGPKSKPTASEARTNGSATAHEIQQASSSTTRAPIPSTVREQQPRLSQQSNATRPITASSRTQSISRRTSMIFEKFKFGSSRKSSMESSASRQNTSTPNLLSQVTSPTTPASIQYSSTAVNGNSSNINNQAPTQDSQNSYPRTSSFSLRNRHFSLSSMSSASLSPTKQRGTNWDRSKSASMATPRQGGGAGAAGYGNNSNNYSNTTTARPVIGNGTTSSRKDNGPPKIDLGNLGVSDWGDSLRWTTTTIHE